MSKTKQKKTLPKSWKMNFNRQHDISSCVLAESDSEGVSSSPKKSHQPSTSVPYCKTYEEIRLEEIQAESAAYYSYAPGDYLNSAGGGKEKRITTLRASRKVCLYSRDKSKDENLGFKVLTLDEIRSRKNSGDKSDKVEKKTVSESELLLSSAIKTLGELRELEKSKEDKSTDKRKRSLETEEIEKNSISSDNEIKRRKISRAGPVRLRRSPKRVNRGETSQEMSDNETRVESDKCESSRTEIEVRLCDSSTDDIANTNQVSTSRETSGEEAQVDTIDDIKVDPLSESGDDEYPDSASDDILKDIDALLTEKTV